MDKINFAVIGPGRIAQAHADVIKMFDHNIYLVIGNKYSQSLLEFEKKNTPNIVAYSIEELKNNIEYIDAVIISVPWNIVEKIVDQVLPLKIPILAEKPVALTLDKLLFWKRNHCIENLYVAYNRAHYDFIKKLKNDLKSLDIFAVDVLSADPTSLMKKKFGDSVLDHFCIYYTSHLIHLLITLFGDINITHIQGRKQAKQVHLQNKMGTPISLNMINDTPQNSYIKIFTSKNVFQILPLEKLTIYNEMVRVKDGNINYYLPQVNKEYETSNDYKQGFKNQLNFFIDNFIKKKNMDLEYYNRVIQVNTLCENLGNKK